MARSKAVTTLRNDMIRVWLMAGFRGQSEAETYRNHIIRLSATSDVLARTPVWEHIVSSRLYVPKMGFSSPTVR